eukprot:TRINITY_DN2567_c0_g1_i21.p5 TRINITY_DN2567_c0_g1~~TRINITY_DN2567_c0_g1_i21.p5  ORF type:complete len:129 (+),score=19.37 TRINITY_DN2567_c0_g1_i21:276-662(+)
MQQMASEYQTAQQQQQQNTETEDYRSVVQEVPQGVTDRMLKRIFIFTGIPVLLGFLLYPAFYYLKVVMKVDVPMWSVYITQLFTFGGGALGITYGVMSTSWDVNREGSFLGWTEFRANLPQLMDRFKK